MREPARISRRLPVAGLLIGILLVAVPGGTRAAQEPPGRVVSLAPSLTELLFAVGAGDAVVGVTTYCNYPDAAKRLPKMGGIEDGSIDLERIFALRPDLVVAIGSQSQTVEVLRRLGLRVEVLPSQTVDDLFNAVSRLGGLLGREAQAERLAKDLRQRIERIRKAVASLPKERRPRVFYQVWDRPLMTATRQTLIGQLIELAGGVNVFGDLPGRYPQVSLEAVLERDPEVIVAPDHHADRVDLRSLAQRPGLADVKAVRSGRIVILNGDLISRAGPRIVEALEILAHALHPRLVSPPKRAGTPGGGRR
ncbi:MAG TPA: cobalamin-binding protein [Thermoanaerobaculia bacterium]